MVGRKVHHDGNGGREVRRQGGKNDGQSFQAANRSSHGNDATGWGALRITHKQLCGQISAVLFMSLFILVEQAVCPEVLALQTQWAAAVQLSAAVEQSVVRELDSLKAMALRRQATRRGVAGEVAAYP